MDTKSIVAMSQTSTEFFSFFREDLENLAMQKLNTCVLHGEEEKAIAIIKSRPSLLLSRGTAADYSGRLFKNLTPFQTALLTHDVALWKKMEDFFHDIPDGIAHKEAQFNETFPNGLPKQKPYNFNTLLKIITDAPITNIETLVNNPSDTTSSLGQAMATFRTEFSDLAMNEGFFNIQHLIKALEEYVQQSNLWSVSQCHLFWSQVIGYTQRFLPACYAQAFCQGLSNVMDNKNQLVRLFKLKNKDQPYFSLISDSKWYFPLLDADGLGFTFALSSSRYLSAFVHGGGAQEGQPTLAASTMRCLKKYVEKIHRSFLELNQECNQPTMVLAV